MVSTRGRYAIRVMIDLAENHDGNYIPLKDIAVIARSNEQLEQIKAVLSCPCHLNRALVVNDPMFITLTFLVKASVLGLDECNKEFFRALTAADPVLTSKVLGIGSALKIRLRSTT